MAKALLYEVVPTEAASRFGALPVPVRDIVKLCDGTRTLDAICARSPLSGQRTEQVVGRLLELGVIQRRPAARARRRNITPEGTAWIAGGRPAPIASEPAIAAEPPPAPRILVETATPASQIFVEAAPPIAAPDIALAMALGDTLVMNAPNFGANGFSVEEEHFFNSSIDHLVQDDFAD